MKKYILLIIPFLLTGCIDASGTLVKTCTKDEYSSSIKETKKYVVEFRKNIINTVTFTDTFESDIDMSNAIKSYEKAYRDVSGVSVSTDTNSIQYIFDMSKISDEVKKEFNLTNKYSDLEKKLKGSGFVCK